MSSTLLFSRNAEGEVKLANGITFNVPKTRTALSFLNEFNHIENGDSIKENGWIYKDGVKYKKWFRSYSRFGIDKVWEPHLYDLPFLCDLYLKLKKDCAQKHNETWDLLRKFKGKKKEVNVAAPGPKIKKDNSTKYVLYNVHNHGDGLSYSVDWHVPEENLPADTIINDETKRLYYLKECFERRGKVFYAIQTYLQECVLRFLPKVDKNNYDQEIIEVWPHPEISLIYKTVSTGYTKYWVFSHYGKVQVLTLQGATDK